MQEMEMVTGPLKEARHLKINKIIPNNMNIQQEKSETTRGLFILHTVVKKTKSREKINHFYPSYRTIKSVIKQNK